MNTTRIYRDKKHTKDETTKAAARADIYEAFTRSDLFREIYGESYPVEDEMFNALVEHIETISGAKARKDIDLCNEISEAILDYTSQVKMNGVKIGYNLAMRLLLQGVFEGISL